MRGDDQGSDVSARTGLPLDQDAGAGAPAPGGPDGPGVRIADRFPGGRKGIAAAAGVAVLLVVAAVARSGSQSPAIQVGARDPAPVASPTLTPSWTLKTDTGTTTSPGVGADPDDGDPVAPPSSSGAAVPVYTPGGPEPALQPVASLPGVTSADPHVPCPAATVEVGDAAALAAALKTAQPGTVIGLRDGTYLGNFTGVARGTADRPVFLCGGPGAVLDAGTAKSKGGYVLHLQNAEYWRLVGFTVQNGQKGVVLDHTHHSVIEDLTVRGIGDEAIHLREFSDDNLVLHNSVHDTGLRQSKYGEGVYIGTAKSNWCTYTACQPDRSDNNVVRDNTFARTTAENVDIKEGTTGGALIGNHFDGGGFDPKGADAWVNAKGNGYLVRGNAGSGSPQDGFQTHQILDGWGRDNRFEGNTATVNGTGFGFHFTPVNDNVWTCDNKVQNAERGAGNTPCAS